MAADRYVLLGLAHVRSTWFNQVARWATAGSAPIEFLKCLTAEELRARLGSGRVFSALLIDESLPSLDRDVIDAASSADCPVVVVGTPAAHRDWSTLGAVAALDDGFDRSTLLDTLVEHAQMVGDAAASGVADDPDTVTAGWRGRLVGVTGSAGAGVSTTAMALAQGCGNDIRHAGLVVLADMQLNADLAMLHDARDIVPGVQELVEAHRSGRPSAEQVRALTFDIVDRKYQLLLGLRRHRDWAVLRPRAFEAALDSLRRTYRMVVADVGADLEGEADCGAIEVEERNVMARTVATGADVMVVVGQPGLKGLHSLVRTIDGLRHHGVDSSRIVAVVNQATRNQRARAELTRAFAELTGATARPERAVAGPIYVPERRGLEELIRDATRLPGSLATTLANTMQATLERSAAVAATAEPIRVIPGSLGSWYDEEAAAR